MQDILLSGIYPPIPTFFTVQDELDLVTLREHVLRLADSGIAGYVLMGTNGEAVHLDDEERLRLIQAAREVIDSIETKLPLIVGCGAQSTRATIGYCRQAENVGADIALVLPPFYYKGRMDSQALVIHYRTVADNSPLPVLLYNMPASSAGVDLDSSTVCTLANHPNIIGIKDSSGSIDKIAQIVAAVPTAFRVFVGSASNLLPALAVGAVGAVSALANIFPQAVCLLQALFEAGELEEARALQARIIPANAAVTTLYSVPGLKAALEITTGYGGKPRMPLLPLSEPERMKLQAVLKSAKLENTDI